jgi:heptosyltransferase-2
VLEALHSEFPNAALHILVRKGNGAIYEQHPFLNRVIEWDKKSGKYRSLFNLLGAIRKEKYQLVVNLHRFASSGLLTAFSGAKKTVGFDKNPLSFAFSQRFPHRIGADEQGNFAHEIERNYALIAELCPNRAHRPRLYPELISPSTNARRVFDQAAQGKYICIAPASVWQTKAWPIESWIQLIEACTSHRIFILGGPSDAQLSESIRSQAHHSDIINTCGHLSLLESAALMKKARMNFVNDSAPLHLCTAVDAPVTAIFCSTLPSFGFGPLAPNGHAVETRETLTCRPCGLHGRTSCPLTHFNCAHSIRIDDVLAPLRAISDQTA